MRDPFPIPPIKWLQRASHPLAKLLGLETLPLHVHEIAIAGFFYHFLFAFLAPGLSARFAPGHYAQLPRDKKLQWNMKVVSFIQSTLISGLSLLVMNLDEERATMGHSERIWGYTGAAGMVQALAVGYFLWDAYIMARYTDVFGVAMLVHGVACSVTFSLGFRPVLNYYGCVFMLYELSTPLLNIHWVLDKVGMTGSRLQIGNGIALIATFFFVRLVYGGIMSTHLYSDVWRALKLECESVVPTRDFHVQDAFKLLSPLVNCPLPKWILLLYLGGHVTLNSLNVYWFGAMIRAIRRRADCSNKTS